MGREGTRYAGTVKYFFFENWPDNLAVHSHCTATIHNWQWLSEWHHTEGQPEELGSVMTLCITIYGIKRFDFRMVCLLHALLSKNLLILWTFPLLYPSFTILFSYVSLFLCLLSVTNWPCFHFYLVQFYYKTSVHRERKLDHYYPSELISENLSNFVFCSCNFVILSHSIAYHLLIAYFIHSSPTLLCYIVSCLIAHHSLLYHIKFSQEFSLYYILLFLISSYRLLKKGLTCPHSIFHFVASCPHVGSCRTSLVWRGLLVAIVDNLVWTSGMDFVPFCLFPFTHLLSFTCLFSFTLSYH